MVAPFFSPFTNSFVNSFVAGITCIICGNSANISCNLYANDHQICWKYCEITKLRTIEHFDDCVFFKYSFYGKRLKNQHLWRFCGHCFAPKKGDFESALCLLLLPPTCLPTSPPHSASVGPNNLHSDHLDDAPSWVKKAWS